MLDMSSIIFANPGQTVSLAVQVTDGYGDRVDGYTPIVKSVYFPDLSSAIGYPVNMTRLTTGLYTHSLTIPSGIAAVGTYIASISWPTPDNMVAWEIFQIHVALPFGTSSVSPL